MRSPRSRPGVALRRDGQPNALEAFTVNRLLGGEEYPPTPEKHDDRQPTPFFRASPDAAPQLPKRKPQIPSPFPLRLPQLIR
jgi:hypothetical protein